MNLWQLVAVTLVCAFMMQESEMIAGIGNAGLRRPIKAVAFASGAIQSNQAGAGGQTTRQEQFQTRRAHFGSGIGELMLTDPTKFAATQRRRAS